MNELVENLVRRLPPSTIERVGSIVKAYGTTLRASGLDAQIGSLVAVFNSEVAPDVNDSTEPEVRLYADVIGIDGTQLILFPLGSIDGIHLGSEVRLVSRSHHIEFSSHMPGRVYNGVGDILDGEAPSVMDCRLPLIADAPSPIHRLPINEVFVTGVRAIDSLLTVGRGQRIGIFAAAGAGKSTLLSMLATDSSADVVVIALVGERGREVAEFINEKISAETRERTVLVVATSDRPAMERVRAARFATSVAEGFREQGKNVLLLMDSITRYARAMREIGLSAGETPVRHGFPGSVFADLPKLLERTGNNNKGSITAFYTVLTEDETSADPISEEVRSILDGHLVLSRQLGEAGHYPAIDVLDSTSRLFLTITSKHQQKLAMHVRQLLAKYLSIEFLVQVGEYTRGTDLLADKAIDLHPGILEFLQQSHDSSCSLSDTLEQLQELIA